MTEKQQKKELRRAGTQQVPALRATGANKSNLQMREPERAEPSQKPIPEEEGDGIEQSAAEITQTPTPRDEDEDDDQIWAALDGGFGLQQKAGLDEDGV